MKIVELLHLKIIRLTIPLRDSSFPVSTSTERQVTCKLHVVFLNECLGTTAEPTKKSTGMFA